MPTYRYNRDLYDFNTSFRNKIIPDLFQTGYTSAGKPGLQQALRNIIADKDGKKTFLLSGFAVDTATWTIDGDSYAVAESDYVKVSDGDAVPGAAGDYIFLTTGGELSASSSFDVHGTLIGKRVDASTFNDLRNGYVNDNDLWTERHSEHQKFLGQIYVSGISTFVNDVDITTGLTAVDVSVSNNFSVTEKSTFNGDTYFLAGANVTGTLAVEDLSTINPANFNEKIYSHNDLHVTGNAYLASTGQINKLSVTGELYATGQALISGNVEISSDLTVLGKIDGYTSIASSGVADGEGIKLTMTAGESISKYDVVTVSSTSNEVIKSQNTSTRTPSIGIALNAASSDEDVTILIFGTVTHNPTFSQSAGSVLYQSSSAGEVTITPTGTISPIGIALGNHTMFVNPSNLVVNE